MSAGRRALQAASGFAASQGGAVEFEFVGFSSGQQQNTLTPLNIPVIADVEEGDTLVVFTTAEGDLTQPPAGEDWTVIDREDWADANHDLGVFTRLVTDDEPATNYAFVADSGVKQVGIAAAYRGSYDVHVVGAWATAGGVIGAGNPHNANAITTTEDAIVIAVQNHYPFTGQTPSASAATGLTRRGWQENNGGMPSRAYLYDSDDIVPAGEYDTVITGSGAIGPCVLLFSLTPA